METVGALLRVVAYGALAAALGVAAAADLARRIVPDGCVVAVAASGAAEAALRVLLDGCAPEEAVGRALAGGACVLAVMASAALASARVRGAPGVGGGDIKLLSAVGVWAGPVGGLAVVALSCLLSVSGWCVSNFLSALSGHKGVIRRDNPTVCGIPLAPSVALAALTVILAGPT